ncbi:helix-turn-helix domain-containing protein [Chryseobacterium sp. GMJ5]|uniref:Helix-turn-helix domain-containing protein n=1 Tax=Chryseobacterium gilvum TaxID=2976534 RepID=A0ABT2VVI9_9FLAO|nr:helix-turn-helix transcriptional regulator [Chryseobacterium gilvum]MCU7613770.1 helix-turn-helix domain-containing protein [Chryseobacterium gilvum]
MSLNERIAKVIGYSGFTASEFADEIDVQRSSVSHITSGRNKPSLEFIIKIKSRFPEILWDWLVNGEGEMLKSELPHESEEIENIEEKTKPTSIPDLFTMMNTDEDFGMEEAKEETRKNNSPESNITKPNIENQKISDSQPLEHLNNFALNPSSENQNHKIKRIVFFYENGTFESFEP